MPQIVARTLIILLMTSLHSCAVFGPRSIKGVEMKLSRFKSDGCSVFPDGRLTTRKNEWLHCCFAHDISYWIGGPKVDKQRADHELNQCVAKVTNRSQGEAMELGVEMGGSPQTGLPWRWGYGWDIEAPYFEREERHTIMIRQEFNSIYEELDNWLSKLTETQVIYIQNQINQLQKRLNI